MNEDYRQRRYLSAVEAARVLDLPVRDLHGLVKAGILAPEIAASGQQRFCLEDLRRYRQECAPERLPLQCVTKDAPARVVDLESQQCRMVVGDAANMAELSDESVHLMVTSPPYFNAKMYSDAPLAGDLGNIHDLDQWLDSIALVWAETFRVLQPGRKAFVNIMNLPVRLDGGGFKSLNLTGKTIDLFEKIGFVFKRDIIWHKTNGVRAHFGTYPNPGGILLNHMHEFILEFHKPDRKGFAKYGHVTPEQREQSKLDKEFWLSLKNSDVWTMKPAASGGGRSHAAPFPVELPWRLIKAYSYVGETVLDPFAGSGTTLLAASSLERQSVGYEIHREIVDMAVERLRGSRHARASA